MESRSNGKVGTWEPFRGSNQERVRAEGAWAGLFFPISRTLSTTSHHLFCDMDKLNKCKYDCVSLTSKHVKIGQFPVSASQIPQA